MYFKDGINDDVDCFCKLMDVILRALNVNLVRTIVLLFFWKWTARILFGVIFTNNLNVALKDASVTGGEIQSHVSGRGLGYCRFRIIMSVATLPEWDRTSRELFFSTTKRRAAVFYSCSNAEGVWEDMAFLCFCPNTSLSSNLHYFWGRFLPTRR
jgi:hypothetical protein